MNGRRRACGWRMSSKGHWQETNATVPDRRKSTLKSLGGHPLVIYNLSSYCLHWISSRSFLRISSPHRREGHWIPSMTVAAMTVDHNSSECTSPILLATHHFSSPICASITVDFFCCQSLFSSVSLSSHFAFSTNSVLKFSSFNPHKCETNDKIGIWEMPPSRLGDLPFHLPSPMNI